MLLHVLHKRSLDFYKLMPEEKFDGKNDQTKDEHENTDAVDAMHVLHKPGFRSVRVRFFNVEIFRYLPKYTHKKTAS